MSSDNSGTQSSYGNLNGDVGGIEHPANDEPSITCLASRDFSHVLTQVSTMHYQLKWLHLADKQHAMGWQVAAISGSNRPGFCQKFWTPVASAGFLLDKRFEPLIICSYCSSLCNLLHNSCCEWECTSVSQCLSCNSWYPDRKGTIVLVFCFFSCLNLASGWKRFSPPETQHLHIFMLLARFPCQGFCGGSKICSLGHSPLES